MSRESSRQSYSSSSPSSSSSSDVNYVSVSAEFTRGILNSDLAKNLQMSAADPNAFIGSYNHNHGAYGAII